ncbi:MAG: GDP-mannose 4,6-dehydratase [Acidobacteriota bacterium]|nr:GDP-mannose 4,6-dehydratase [Acidobacteriota bacterium]
MERQHVFITGGAGFIGTNVAYSYLENDQPVHILDNLSRPGGERNIADLFARFPGRVEFTRADIRDKSSVVTGVRSARAVYHLAAQVAVTTSLNDPIADADTNLLGTLNLLEAIRKTPSRPPLLFTSTNKVYGSLSGIPLCERAARYEPRDTLARAGVGETQSLEFLSPYGCSKGSADQYVLDYARSFGLHATVFRMSCIYGPHQLGSEDQGWVAHFLRQALKGESIKIFGDGKQVRDLLHVKDLVRAMHTALDRRSESTAEAFNIGGGAENSASLLEVISQIKMLTRSSPRVEWDVERRGDQKWYVSDISKATRILGWRPEISVRQGLSNLLDWYSNHPELVSQSDMQVA